jgi:hypothetical protein
MIGGFRLWAGLIVGAGVMAFPAFQVGHMRGFDAGSLAYELEFRRLAEETREDLRHVETSTGDAGADLDFIRCVVLGVCAPGTGGAASPRQVVP